MRFRAVFGTIGEFPRTILCAGGQIKSTPIFNLKVQKKALANSLVGEGLQVTYPGDPIRLSAGTF